VPNECEGLPTDLPGVKRGPFKELINQAHMFIFEFGLATQSPDEPVRRGRLASTIDEKRLKAVAKLFRQAASTEHETRPTGRRLPRRFIGVNVIYNKYWPLFTDHIGANINPFCSQVLAGVRAKTRRCVARCSASAVATPSDPAGASQTSKRPAEAGLSRCLPEGRLSS
jgi:hypothetical protein